MFNLECLGEAGHVARCKPHRLFWRLTVGEGSLALITIVAVSGVVLASSPEAWREIYSGFGAGSVGAFIRGGANLATSVPMVFVLLMAFMAGAIQLGQYYRDGDWTLVVDSIMLIVTALVMLEAISVLLKHKRAQGAGSAPASAEI